MREWLLLFQRRVGERQAALLLDNLRADELQAWRMKASYRRSMVRHIIQWGVDAWKIAVKVFTLEHCFEARGFQPAPESESAVDNIPELEEEILELFVLYIQVTSYFCLTQFINPSTEIHMAILQMQSWPPISLTKSMSQKAIATPPPITPSTALAHIDGLLLYPLQVEPTAKIMELQHVLNRENKRSEVLEL